MTQSIPSFGMDVRTFIRGLLNPINTSVEFFESCNGGYRTILKVGAGDTVIGATAGGLCFPADKISAGSLPNRN